VVIAPEQLAETVKLYEGDCMPSLREIPTASVHCCVTSPPYYGLRDYGHAGQIGLEDTPEKYVDRLVDVFREVRRALRDDGTLWLNLGDSYAGSWGAQSREHAGKHSSNVSAISANQVRAAQRKQKNTGSIPAGSGLKPKDLIGAPWAVAFALRADGWYLRQDIIWHKPNPMPESVRDRCVKAHEYLFLLSKSARYHFDHEAIVEPAAYAGQRRGGSTRRYEQNAAGMDKKVYDKRTRRSVWSINPSSCHGAHFAVFPQELVRPCILAGCPAGGIVLDPFAGSGTTALVSMAEGRNTVLCELNPDYCGLIRTRVRSAIGLFTGVGGSHGDCSAV
jgi:DNA modification methylase